MKTSKKKVVKGWAIVGKDGEIWEVLHGNSGDAYFIAISSTRDEAISIKREEMIDGERVVPCTITYEI
jgi:hypothetical protein